MKDTKDTKGPYALEEPLAECLSALLARVEATDAATIAAQAAPTLLQAIKDSNNPNAVPRLARGLSALLARVEAADAATIAAQAAPTLAQTMMDTNNSNLLEPLGHGLSAFLSAVAPEEIPVRSRTAASAVAFSPGTGHPLNVLALLSTAEPPPCRLSTSQLVELLKMPGFVGAARRVVLDHLGNRYRRHFADVWEFVRFAREQHLGLDFTTPPQRPAATASGR
jgi:hypothetical protein